VHTEFSSKLSCSNALPSLAQTVKAPRLNNPVQLTVFPVRSVNIEWQIEQLVGGLIAAWRLPVVGHDSLLDPLAGS
jgi:hypothetical protein